MENQENPKFIYPIPFDSFVNYQKDFKEQRQESIPKLHQLHKLKKLKKMLEQTQHRIQNRIKLFKKVSYQISKKKQKQKQQTQKLQAIRSHPFFAIRKTQNQSFQKQKIKIQSMNNKYINIITQKDQQVSIDNKQNQIKKIQKIQQQKIVKAKNIKLEKLRYKMLIDQNKNKELRKKMQSAGFIRKQRGKAKEIKQQMQKQIKISIRRERQEKYFQQQQQYDELKRNLTKLQIEEREALIQWKKTIEQ